MIKRTILEELKQSGESELLKYVKDYIRNDCFYIFDLDDPESIMDSFKSYVKWKTGDEDE